MQIAGVLNDADPPPRCAISGTDDLELLHVSATSRCSMGCTTRPASTGDPPICRGGSSHGSGLIQLNPLLPLEVLYPESHGMGSIGALWARHHEAFARFVNAGQPRAVFEIGGSHGIPRARVPGLRRRALDHPRAQPRPGAGHPATFIRGFFDAQSRFDGEFDTVVHSACLRAHLRSGGLHGASGRVHGPGQDARLRSRTCR